MSGWFDIDTSEDLLCMDIMARLPQSVGVQKFQATTSNSWASSSASRSICKTWAARPQNAMAGQRMPQHMRESSISVGLTGQHAIRTMGDMTLTGSLTA